MLDEVEIPSSRRMQAPSLVCLIFLAMGLYMLGIGLFDIPSLLHNHINFSGYIFNLLDSLACILAAYGLWKRRPFGWWIGAIFCAGGIAATILGSAAIILMNHTSARHLAGQARRIPIFNWPTTLWLMVYAVLLVMLFHRSIMAQFIQGPLRRAQRALIVGFIAITLPILGGVISAFVMFTTNDFNGLRPHIDPSTTFAMGAGSIRQMALSPDGKTLAFQTSDSEEPKSSRIGLLDIASDKVRWVKLPHTIFYMRWGPDSRIVAVNLGSDQSVKFIDISSASIVWAKTIPALRMAFHPDGSFWYLDNNDNTLWRTDLQTKTTQRWSLNPCDPIHDFAISPDGKQLALAWGHFDDMSIMVLDSGSGQRLEKWADIRNPHITDMRFSRDGRWLLTAHTDKGTNGLVKVWNATTGEMEYVLQDLYVLFFDFDHMALSPDGRFLSAQSVEGRHEIWSLEKRAWIWKMPNDDSPMRALDPGIISGNSKEFWTSTPFSIEPFGAKHGSLQRWRFQK